MSLVCFGHTLTRSIYFLDLTFFIYYEADQCISLSGPGAHVCKLCDFYGAARHRDFLNSLARVLIKL
jgi:hypothetical protein